MRVCKRSEYSGTFAASCSVSTTTCGITLASTPSTSANAMTKTKMIARARGIFLLSKKSTTGDKQASDDRRNRQRPQHRA